MKTVLICLLLITKSFEANSCIADVIYNITPGNKFFSHEQAKVNIQQGNPLTDEQEPIIVFREKQWLSLSEKIVCPQPFLRFATNQFDKQLDSSDHHSGNHHPVSQLSGFVQ